MSVCVNDTDGDGNCPACARNPEAPCRVSVNIEAILIGLFSVAHTPEQAQHAAREVMRQYAHELAEKIRAHEWRECCGAGCSDLAPAGADLIDPEVLNSE